MDNVNCIVVSNAPLDIRTQKLITTIMSGASFKYQVYETDSNINPTHINIIFNRPKKPKRYEYFKPLKTAYGWHISMPSVAYFFIKPRMIDTAKNFIDTLELQ